MLTIISKVELQSLFTRMSLKEIKETDLKYIITFSVLLCNKEYNCCKSFTWQSGFMQSRLYLSEQDNWLISSFKNIFYVYLFELFPKGICLCGLFEWVMENFRNPVIWFRFPKKPTGIFFFFGSLLNDRLTWWNSKNLFLTWILKARDFLGTHSSYWNGDANCTYYITLLWCI